MFWKSSGKSRAGAVAPQVQRPAVEVPKVKPVGDGIPSLLSADLAIIGDVFSNGSVQVDGDVRGDIRAARLTIGVEARIAGRIEADTARIDGTVVGRIDVRDLSLSKSAKVTGDVNHETLTIEPGASVVGNFKREM